MTDAAATPTLDGRRILAALEHAEAELSLRGVTLVHDAQQTLSMFRWLLTEGRHPRVVVVGRRGAAKSSLLNALADRELAPTGAVEDTTGSAMVHTLTIGEREVHWVDTGGLRAGSRGPQRALSLRLLFRCAAPDLLIVAQPASEVDAAIDGVLADVASALEALEPERRAVVRVLPVCTRVDELSPADDLQPPFKTKEKIENIELSRRTMDLAISRAKIPAPSALATNSWFDSHHDLRWNIDALRQAIVEQTPVTSQSLIANELRTLIGEVTTVLVNAARVLGERTSPQFATEWLIETSRRMAPSARMAASPSWRSIVSGRAHALSLVQGALGLARAHSWRQRIRASQLTTVGEAIATLCNSAEDAELLALVGVTMA
ncbi:MAG: GTPase domain-containing protein [Deltaproteobacteria bacterium]|nr:GTPase domain-containing protein [Deltaproteobacteria bacterium]